MKEKSRALTRHHAERVKVNKKDHINDWNLATECKQEPSDRHIGKNAATPANCSCWMCGNPRKYFSELTIQEKSALEAELYFPDDKEYFNYMNTEPHLWREAEKEHFK